MVAYKWYKRAAILTDVSIAVDQFFKHLTELGEEGNAVAARLAAVGEDIREVYIDG